MSLFQTDPLLAVCRLLAWLILGFLGIALIGLFAGMIALWAAGDQISQVVVQSYPDMQRAGLLPLATLIVVLAGVAVALLGRFMLHLLAIINAIAQGLTFTLANAGRVRAMAWLSLLGIVATFLLSIPAKILSDRLGEAVDGASLHFAVESGSFDLGQVMLTLVLFVLARLFAQAAAMREEIEETI